MVNGTNSRLNETAAGKQLTLKLSEPEQPAAEAAPQA
jgi:hypothetical protein